MSTHEEFESEWREFLTDGHLRSYAAYLGHKDDMRDLAAALAYELIGTRAEVERLEMAWNEASATKHRLLKEVRALDAEAARLRADRRLALDLLARVNTMLDAENVGTPDYDWSDEYALLTAAAALEEE